MRYSILTITSAAVAAVGTNATKTAGKSDCPIFTDGNTNDSAEVPSYEPIPKATTNKYDHVPGHVPDFATGPFEPSYMPEEDLELHARSVSSTSTSAQATSAADEPVEGSYEAFVKWMEARIGQEAVETPETSHVARSVAPSSGAKAEVLDRPADDSYEGFKHWMEALYPGEVPEETKQKLHARGTSTPAGHATASTHISTATAGPAEGSYEAFKHWMKIRFPQGFSQEEDHKMLARSTDEHDDYPSEEFHELGARSVEDHVQQEPDWSQYWPQEEEEHLHARSTEDEFPYDHEYDSEHIAARSETVGDYSYGGTFEEFLARQGINPEEFAQSASTESHEEDPQPQASIESAPQVSEIPATPAAAPTPKPTSADTSSATTSTSASLWTGETATASSGSATTNAQARSVSSHYRFRHHSAHASDSATATASPAATSSTTTSRTGFFNLPW